MFTRRIALVHIGGDIERIHDKDPINDVNSRASFDMPAATSWGRRPMSTEMVILAVFLEVYGRGWCSLSVRDISHATVIFWIGDDRFLRVLARAIGNYPSI